MSKIHYTVFNDLVRRIRSNENWFEEFMTLVDEYYDHEPCGGSLHVVLEDGNMELSSINWCAGYAAGVEDSEGSDIANLMLHMTWNQRRRVNTAMAWGRGVMKA